MALTKLYNKLWFNLLFPYHTVTYFHIYQNVLRKTILEKHRPTLWFIRAFALFQLLKAGHFFYLGYTPLSNLDRVLHFDGLHLIMPKPKFNFIGFYCTMIEVLYAGRVLLFKQNLKLNNFLENILFHDDCRFFISANYGKLDKFIPNIIRQHFLVLINLFQSFILVIGFLFTYTHAVFSYRIFDNFEQIFANYSSLGICIALLGHLTSALGYWFYYLSVSHVIAITFTWCGSLLLVFFIKMRQINRMFSELFQKRNNYSAFGYRQLKRRFVETLLHFFATNKMYGRLFLSSLLVFCPASAVLLLWTLREEGIEIRDSFFMIFFVVYQFVFIFVIHLSLAYCTKRIHAPAGQLVRQMVHNQHRVGDLRAKMLIANDIIALHTNNRYGFTYGPFGLVSMATFAKYLMLYGKFIMISYKLMQRKVI